MEERSTLAAALASLPTVGLSAWLKCALPLAVVVVVVGAVPSVVVCTVVCRGVR